MNTDAIAAIAVELPFEATSRSVSNPMQIERRAPVERAPGAHCRPDFVSGRPREYAFALKRLGLGSTELDVASATTQQSPRLYLHRVQPAHLPGGLSFLMGTRSCAKACNWSSSSLTRLRISSLAKWVLGVVESRVAVSGQRGLSGGCGSMIARAEIDRVA